MGRGYWLPPAYENLAACDGFYIEAEAVYTGDPYDDWEKFINTLSVKLSYREKTLEKNMRMETLRRRPKPVCGTAKPACGHYRGRRRRLCGCVRRDSRGL